MTLTRADEYQDRRGLGSRRAGNASMWTIAVDLLTLVVDFVLGWFQRILRGDE